MFTAFDFINTYIPGKKMRFGWKIELKRTNGALSNATIVLKYTMLNFDWKSVEWLGHEAMDKFLLSDSFKNFKKREDTAMKRFKRLYYDASSIEELKISADNYDLKIDIDKLIDKVVKKKSEKLKGK